MEVLWDGDGVKPPPSSGVDGHTYENITFPDPVGSNNPLVMKSRGGGLSNLHIECRNPLRHTKSEKSLSVTSMVRTKTRGGVGALKTLHRYCNF